MINHEIAFITSFVVSFFLFLFYIYYMEFREHFLKNKIKQDEYFYKLQNIFDCYFCGISEYDLMFSMPEPYFVIKCKKTNFTFYVMMQGRGLFILKNKPTKTTKIDKFNMYFNVKKDLPKIFLMYKQDQLECVDVLDLENYFSKEQKQFKIKKMNESLKLARI